MPEVFCGFKDFPVEPNPTSGDDLLEILGPTLLVNIGFDNEWDHSRKLNPKALITDVSALVDTGASISCIDDELAKNLNLPQIDELPFAGCLGTQVAKIYLAQIYIPSLDFTIYGRFAGVHLKAGGQLHRTLLGRSFLHRFEMYYNGKTGDVTLKS
jgi:hypothetical protein